MHRGDPNEIAVEERGREGEGEEEGAVGGRDPEAHEGEDGLGDDQGRRSPPHGGYRGRFGGADIHREPHGLDPPEPDPMLILGGLVDALRMAGLRANPRCVREFRQGRGQIGMGPDDLSDDLSDDEQPRVKIHPPIFKGTPGERPDAHIYAADDWMEVMRVRRDDFITKFKHTLNHLAREWYHSLDLDQFRGISLPPILVGISQLKVET